MTKHPKTLLSIVTEAVLERTLIDEARALGAQGWTVAEVHGASLEGIREGAWEADRTVEIKLICDERVADAIAERVLERYAPHYSVAMVFSAVSVLRPERF
jgi:nitrogen regulatory protein P-II 2